MRQALLSIFFVVFGLTSNVLGQGEIKVNQIGFYPKSEKLAVIPTTESGEFVLEDKTSGQVVFTGILTAPKLWSHSGETVAIADFSDFEESGEYILRFGDLSSYPFRIGDGVHFELAKAAIKAFYFNRASTALPAAYAGSWARPAGHPDTSVRIHASAATSERPVNSLISAPKGWYDAGDYNKYVVNSGISTYTLLAAYEHFPSFYQNLHLNIPESGNGVPDILNEVRWNLDWMLAMQDPNDGGVYHKLTTPNFAGIIMPHQGVATRYVVMKSTAAALNFSAVMATAARVYGAFDEEFAQRCLDAALYAWEWAIANPAVYYIQPSDVFTGQYGDQNVSDEFDWAAAELYITTRNDDFWNARNFPAIGNGVPAWPFVRPLAWVSLGFHIDDLTPAANRQLIENRLINQANTLRNHYQSSAYRVSMGHQNSDFVWGSNGTVANQGLMLLQAYRITENESYLNAAIAALDYLMGRNATGYSFVTGHGTKPPMFPHHRQSAADNVADPVPGWLAGGPHSGQQDGCQYPSNQRALSYLDHWCSYSTNEVAINWNAPLVYLTGAIEHYKTTGLGSGFEQGEGLPNQIKLGQNFPNPFNPSTVIDFELPSSGRVSLSVYDMLGRQVISLINGPHPAGNHTISFDATGLSSGIYLYRLSFGSSTYTKKMTVLK